MLFRRIGRMILSGDFELKLDGQDTPNDDHESALSVKRPTLI
jgi:hypothetical protein